MSALTTPKVLPSVGRIVHYCESHSQCSAAMVADVLPSGLVNLHVFRRRSEGLNFAENVPYDERLIENTWHWPERVPEKAVPEVLRAPAADRDLEPEGR